MTLETRRGLTRAPSAPRGTNQGLTNGCARNILQQAGLAVEVHRESKAFVEAVVCDKELRLPIQWVRDSAYRFFPPIEGGSRRIGEPY